MKLNPSLFSKCYKILNQSGCTRLLISLLLACVAQKASAFAEPTLEWVRQPSGTAHEVGRSVSADSLGNAFVSGWVEGGFAPGLAGRDAFLQKFDAAGNLSWTRRFGSTDHESSWGVAADGLGSIYVTGETGGVMGVATLGDYDAYLRKYDSAGNVLWTNQFGTAASDQGLKVVVDTLGSVFSSGSTRGAMQGAFQGGDGDAFIRKFDSSGAPQWTRQIGSGGTDIGEGLAADNLGNVFVGGWTDGNVSGTKFGSWDAFLAKYDAAGNQLWRRQFGTSQDDRAFGLSTDDSGNVYVTGFTSGNLASTTPSGSDVFLRKYGPTGNVIWTRQFGSSINDIGHEVSTDALGNIYLTGETSGNWAGPSAGDRDAFVVKVSSLGDLQWTRQLGSDGADDGFGISASDLGHLFITGRAGGNLANPLGGFGDVFVAKYNVVPEPACVSVITLCLLILFQTERSSRSMLVQ